MNEDQEILADDDPDMDVIFGGSIDALRAEKELNQNVGKRGTYEMDPDELGEFQTFPQTPREEDAERRSFRLVGRARFAGGTEIARVQVTLSPDARVKRDYETGNEIPGKHDAPYVRWLEAVQAYQDTHGEAPKDERAVIAYLRTGPAWYMLSPIGGELRVVRITGKRKGR